MEHLDGTKKIVMVGLNPTKEAIQNKAVFSTKKTFWNILKEAELIHDFPDDLRDCAKNVFAKGEDLGFADLVPNCNKKNSKNVKIAPYDVPTLLDKIEKTQAEKVVLLGQKVAEAFVKHLGLKEEYKMFKDCKKYGLFCHAEYQNGNKFKVYIMPFPETCPIPNKSTFYNKILK